MMKSIWIGANGEKVMSARLEEFQSYAVHKRDNVKDSEGGVNTLG